MWTQSLGFPGPVQEEDSMGVLESVNEPRDLLRLTDQQLNDLATEIREFLVDKVKAVVLWHVHAVNFLQVKRLGFA